MQDLRIYTTEQRLKGLIDPLLKSRKLPELSRFHLMWRVSSGTEPMNQKETTRNIEEIERNPIGIPTIAAKEICAALDQLVAGFSVQFHQYLKHHWVVEGPEHRDLHNFFDNSYETVKDQLDSLAERMTTLGAIPTSRLEDQASKSFIEAESPGMPSIREMLENDLRNEQSLLTVLRETIKTANRLADYGTETLLKGILVIRERQAHELEHYLKSDSLAHSVMETARF